MKGEGKPETRNLKPETRTDSWFLVSGFRFLVFLHPSLFIYTPPMHIRPLEATLAFGLAVQLLYTLVQRMAS